MFSKNTMFSVRAAGFLLVSTGFLRVSTCFLRGFYRFLRLAARIPPHFLKKKTHKLYKQSQKVSPGLVLHQKELSDSSTPFKLVRYDLAPVFRCLLL